MNLSLMLSWTREVGLINFVLRRLRWRWLSKQKESSSKFFLPGGQRIRLPHHSFFASDIYLTRGYVDWGAEQLLLDYLKSQPPGITYDVGANMGYYSLLLSGCSLQVVAFEPDPRNHAALLAQGISNLTLVPEAVSNEVGSASFDVSGASTVGHLLLKDEKPGALTVKMNTLDNYRAQHPSEAKVRAVKMDVEGYEILALQGAVELTRQEQPVYLIEYGLDADAPNTIRGLAQFLADHQYSLYAMIRKPSFPLGNHTQLKCLQANEIEGLDFKMLFLVPPGDEFFSRQAAANYCFESMRRQQLK